MSDIIAGLQNFSRMVKVSYFFHDKPSRKDSQDMLYREKSSWIPEDKYLPPEILSELEDLKIKLSKIRISSEPQNLSSHELTALKNLSEMNDIIFKKCDKGTAICIMSKENYVNEALSQLNKEKYYEQIPGPIYQNTIDPVNEILEDLKKMRCLNQSQVNYLKPRSEPRERLFYTLPKVHKESNKWLTPHIPPGRPIVSDIDSDSYRYAEYIDNILKPLSDIHPSYIKNTYHLLEELREVTFNNDAYLVCFDVNSLYTNIQPDKGIEALQKVYERSGLNILEFEHAKALLEISLKNNDFKFGDQHYRQCYGTSMGKIYAPTYANIFMANWEYEIMKKAKRKPDFYRRFIDDAILIWQDSIESLHQFLQLCNSFDESIKISWEINQITCNFLDVTIFKGSRFLHHNILDTKVYFKATDTHELLDKKSYHPRHIFKSIVKSQLIRYRRICNNISDFHEATSILFNVLRERRHYSSRYLRRIKSEFLRIYYHEMGTSYDPSGASMKCGNKKCECCFWIKETSYINNSDISIEGRMDCNSKNVIYIIECQKCHIEYIGETQNALKSRLQRHLSDIRTDKNTSVALHFNYDCPSDYNLATLKIYPIETIQVQGSDIKNKQKLLKRETHWIEHLDTLEPNGLNVKRKSERQNIHVAMRYSNTASRAFKLIRESYERLKSLFPRAFTSELVCSYTRNKNISEHLTRARLK